MIIEGTLEEFKTHLKFLQDCCLEHPDYEIERISEVLAFVPAPRDEHGAAIFKTIDNMFGVMTEWQDYTGHG